MINLSSIVVLLQLVLTLLSSPSTASSTQAQALATQAIGMATQALQTITTSTPIVTDNLIVTPLSINYIDPNIVVYGRINIITIHGSGFQDNASVMIGNTTTLTPSNVSENTISVSFPNKLPSLLLAGVYTVTVTNPDGTRVALPNAFTITDPNNSFSQSTIIDNGTTNNVTQNIQELQNQYTQDMGIIQNTPSGLSEQENDENALNQLYNIELQAAQLGVSCFSPNLTLTGGEQGAEILQSAINCVASAQNVQ